MKPSDFPSIDLNAQERAYQHGLLDCNVYDCESLNGSFAHDRIVTKRSTTGLREH